MHQNVDEAHVGAELPVLPEPNHVCFKSAKHPGSIRWREVVKSFADNKVDYPTWTDETCPRIRKVLANENINRFLVSRDVHGNPSNKINQGYWYDAAESEILEKTKQRFLDYRKHKKRKRPQDETRSLVRFKESEESVQSQTSLDVSARPAEPLMAHFQSSLSELVELRPGLAREFHGQPPHVAYSSLCDMRAQLLLLQHFVEQQIQDNLRTIHGHGLQFQETHNFAGSAVSWTGAVPLIEAAVSDSRENTMLNPPLFPVAAAAPCVGSIVGDSPCHHIRTTHTEKETVRGAGQPIDSAPPQSTKAFKRTGPESLLSFGDTKIDGPSRVRARNCRRKASDNCPDKKH